MGTAKVMSLRSRPFQISHLCFDSDGILGELKAQLGATAVAFDFPVFYATLASAPTIAGDPSRLLYDFLAIQAFTAPAALASLRAEQGKAALDKAINARQNAFFAKYGNIAAIVSRINTWYSPSVVGSKPNRLAILAAMSQAQADTLKTAYTSDGRLGVVKTTSSKLNSVTTSGETIQQQGSASETGFTNQASEAAQINESNKLPNLPTNKPIAGWGYQPGSGGPVPIGSALLESDNAAKTTTTESSTTRGLAVEQQAIVNTDYGYRVPYLESQAQNERAQISLIDQQLSEFLNGQQLPNLTQILQNELRSMDGDVYRLQIALLSTILLSPLAGTVTGVYKNPGDPVRAGEPVVRIENNNTVLLVATVVYRDRIAVGSNVTVQTALYDSSTTPTSISGTVVAARGHASEDEQWDIVVKCNNVSGGTQILPIDYHFDYDDTVVTIT